MRWIAAIAILLLASPAIAQTSTYSPPYSNARAQTATGWTRDAVDGQVYLTNAGDEVGIGAEPWSGAKLDVLGGMSVSGTGTFYGDNAAILTINDGIDMNNDFSAANLKVNGSTFIQAVDVAGNASVYFPELTSNGFLTNNGSFSALAVDGNLFSINTNIGIGSSNPSRTLDVNGSIGAGNGSANRPAYTFASDIDTGMRRVTTNTLAFETAGVDRLYINGSGYVGIGSSSPQLALDVAGDIKLGSGAAGNCLYFTTDADQLQAICPGASGAQYTITLPANPPTRNALFGIVDYGLFTLGYLEQIQFNGNNVGIGTDTPVQGLLEVDGLIYGSNVEVGSAAGSTNGIVVIGATGLLTAAKSETITSGVINAGTGYVAGANGTDGYFQLFSEQGVTDYRATLYTNTAMTANTNFYLPPAAPSSQSLLTMTTGGVMGGASTSATLASNISNEVGTGNLMYNTNTYMTGNIGIGTSVPAANLSIIKGTAAKVFKVSSAAAGTGDYLMIDTSGNVGINSTVPTSKLAVDGLIYLSNNSIAIVDTVICRGAGGQLGHVTGGTLTAPVCTVP